MWIYLDVKILSCCFQGMADGKSETDHVGRVHALWRQEMPDVSLEGSAILARARRITLMVRERIVPLLSRHGLDGGEFYVLAALRRAGPPYALRPTELYRSLMVSSGGMTDRLRRLEERGLVRRRPSDQDRRSMLVELTAEGRKLIERAWREDMELENELVAGLGKAERQELASLLEQLARILEKEVSESEG
jgi:DNA-binding MarR family transcriptional regulator